MPGLPISSESNNKSKDLATFFQESIPTLLLTNGSRDLRIYVSVSLELFFIRVFLHFLEYNVLFVWEQILFNWRINSLSPIFLLFPSFRSRILFPIFFLAAVSREIKAWSEKLGNIWNVFWHVVKIWNLILTRLQAWGNQFWQVFSLSFIAGRQNVHRGCDYFRRLLASVSRVFYLHLPP